MLWLIIKKMVNILLHSTNETDILLETGKNKD